MEDEHQRFLEGVQLYGFKNVRLLAQHVGTRNATQVRTHTQKYLLKKQEWDQRHHIDPKLQDAVAEKQKEENVYATEAAIKAEAVKNALINEGHSFRIDAATAAAVGNPQAAP